MLLVADSPETLALCFPDAPRPGPAGRGAWTAADQALWRALAPTAEPSIAPFEPDGSTDFWSRIYLVADSHRSQFDLLREQRPDLLSALGPVACVALTGHGFHGHRSRHWLTARGNCHVSVGLAPKRPAAELIPGLVMAPAVAVVDCLHDVGAGRIRAGIKWVNDVLVAGRKVAGVLTHTSSCGTDIDTAVLGIGLNVDTAPPVEPTPFAPAVGCLADALHPAPAFDRVLGSLLSRLAARCDELRREGPSAIWQAYCAASVILGEAVRIYDESHGERAATEPWPEPLARGIVERIEPDLALRLRGHSSPVTRGRLALEQSCLEFGL